MAQDIRQKLHRHGIKYCALALALQAAYGVFHTRLCIGSYT